MRGVLLLAGTVLAGASLAGVPARAQETELPQQSWSFSGPFGTFDRAAAQRGFQVYREVCSTCHSMNLVAYRNLAGIGLTEAQIRAVAASVEVPGGVNDNGEPVTRPGLPSDHFKAPFANEQAARAANNGALLPDLSVIEKAREEGPDYIFGVLTGYADPPAGVTIAQGMNYNKVFPGHQIAMPQPLHDDQVTYADGTKATIPQMAHDVVTFLTFTANPEMEERKRTGVKIVIFLALLTGLTYSVKRKIWANVH